MATRRILFISGSIGLGHIGRDLAIAHELERQNPGVTVDWLAASPADAAVREAGGRLLEESSLLLDENAIAESHSEGPRLSLIRYAFGAREGWSQNVEVVDGLTSSGAYDLVIGDETYEIVLAYKRDPLRKKTPFVMIYDFVGFDALSWNPLERLGVWMWNRKWSEGMGRPANFVDLSLFIGEEEDVPDRRFGVFLPGRRAWARARCIFVGYVLRFDPQVYSDRAALRRRLGYGSHPLVVCSIGGTAIGRELLELCGRAHAIAAGRLPGLRTVLVCGPRLDAASLQVPEGAEVRGYVPDLHEHLAASDLAIVQGGGSITLELTALRRPFLYFPIEGHSEQEVHVAGRLARQRAGTRMSYSTTSASDLADAIVRNIGMEVAYRPIPVDGARIAAERIAALL